jgi:DNA-binding LytR/AlgR family response regulator
VKIRTVVVDDEKPAREKIKRLLSEHPDFELVGEAADGESAVRIIRELRPDLVFLDVQMPEADGFKALSRLVPPPRIVFATAFDRYAVQAFEVHSLDYLLKPFDRRRFAAALARVRDEIQRNLPGESKLDALLEEIRESARALKRAASAEPPQQGGASAAPAEEGAAGEAPAGREEVDHAAHSPGRGPAASDRLTAKRGQRIYLLDPREVQWFEADGELVLARAGSHRYVVSRTLAELEAVLDPRTFFRSHRSFIVNLAAIGEIIPEDSGNYRIMMRDTERTAVPLSRRQARRLREIFPW